MTLQPADLDRLERLAREARKAHPAVDDWLGHDGEFSAVCRTLVEAIPPAVVSELVAAARLGAAWQEAEAALPEGMVLDGIRRLYLDGMPRHWVARATEPDANNIIGGIPLLAEVGPTPAAALLALAEALRGRAEG